MTKHIGGPFLLLPALLAGGLACSPPASESTNSGGSGGESRPSGSGGYSMTGGNGVTPLPGSGGAGTGGRSVSSGSGSTNGAGGVPMTQGTTDGGAADLPPSTGSGGAATGGRGGGLVRGAAPTEQTASTRGPYEVTRYSTGVADSPDYGAYDVDYPSDATPPFAGVAIIPGFVESRTSVADWGPFLASHGFVAITIDPNSNLDLPAVRATALWAAIGSLKAENSRSNSPLVGKVDVDRLAIMGHSMGGGGTLEAANAHSADLRAAIPLAPWDLTSAFGAITVPTMVLAGQNDAIAPAPQHASPFYAAIPATTVKVYAEFAGGDHLVANSPVTNPAAAILGLSWLKVHLEDDLRYAPFIKMRSELSQFMTSP